MKRRSFKLAALVQTVALGLLVGGTAQAADTFIPLKPRLYIFGVAVEGTAYPGVMVLVNTGKTDLHVSQVSMSDNCHCFSAAVARLPFTVPPGGRHSIALLWSPDAGSTPNIGTVTVVHDQGTSTASTWGYAIPF